MKATGLKSLEPNHKPHKNKRLGKSLGGKMEIRIRLSRSANHNQLDVFSSTRSMNK